VVTFDDITELVSAQRNSAWADIARRIAHEIKNPLTPIQLSAERLKRKYGKEIQTDRQVFDQCTETIIRQVGDIGRMVDEFSTFARMPSAQLEMNDFAGVVKEATILQRVSAGEFDIDVRVPDEPLHFLFDRRLVTQAVTNLVKNAREAIETRQHDEPGLKGRILVEAFIDQTVPVIRVTDNGVGLPKENRSRLTEPYMTTRAKGTGLGLAIVKRIMEEHQGRITLDDAPPDFAEGHGARVSLRFAAQTVEQPALIA
jgi:two-component system nitrogen regulation sensor histidine kinase NtrY